MTISDEQLPSTWSKEAADFINKCIERRPFHRLGFNGPQELKQHPWLADFPWNELEAGVMESPFIPPAGADNYDIENSLSEWKDVNDPLIRNSIELL